MRKVLGVLSAFMLAVSLVAQPTQPTQAQSITQVVTLAWAYPYNYVVLFWSGAVHNACAYRANPRVLLYCADNTYPSVGIVIFQPNDPDVLKRPIVGTIITLEAVDGTILYEGAIPEEYRTIYLPEVAN